MLDALEVQTRDDNRVVMFCKVVIASFNIMSDDYAYTHADDWSSLFEKGWEENPNLTMDKRVEAAKNFAWANLDDTTNGRN